MPSPRVSAILARLDRHADLFDLTSDSLGVDLCEIASVGAHEALVRGEDVDGNPLAPLSPDYERAKSRTHPGLPIGFRDLEMGRLDNFRGDVDVRPDEASVRYGTNGPARDEMSWFCLGDPAANRPPRNVWGFTADSTDAAVDRLTAHFRKHV